MNKQELSEFKESLKAKTDEELVAMENEIIADAEKIDLEAGEKKFKLPEENREEIGIFIGEFIERKSIQWSLALAYNKLVNFWASDDLEINYPMYQQTLTELGNMTYAGNNDWERIIKVNKYLEPNHDEFVEFTTRIYDIADRHSAVIDEQQERQKAKQQEEEKNK